MIVRDLHAVIERRLRDSGQRYTPRRRELVESLRLARRPLTIPELLAARRPSPQSSAYRNLAVLEHAGAVRRVVTDEEFARYELAEDLTEHHHHLICSRCGRVEDAAIPAGLERSIDRTFDRLAQDAGFATVSHRLDLIGLCRSCAHQER